MPRKIDATHVGQDFDEFLAEEGIAGEVEARAIKNELLNEDTPDVISLKFSSQLLSKHSFRFSFVATVNGDSLPQQTVKVDIEKGARINLQCGSRPLNIGVDYLTMELLRRKGKTERGAMK